MVYGSTVLTDAIAHREKVVPSIRAPELTDGLSVRKLITETASLDDNSLYCNLLQCSHFAATCAVAELNGSVVGWLSGYVPPGREDTLFIWQVCVSEPARGTGLGKRLIGEVLARPSSQTYQAPGVYDNPRQYSIVGLVWFSCSRARRPDEAD